MLHLPTAIFLRYNGDPPYGLRGYLDDRVNRIIGYALVRQIREIPGNCRSPKLMRDYVDSCTGDLLVNTLKYLIAHHFLSAPDLRRRLPILLHGLASPHPRELHSHD